MPQEHDDRLEEGLAGALLQPPENLQAFLDHFCGDDSALRSEIEELVKYHRDDFMDRPALELECVREALLGSFAAAGRRVGPYEILEEIGRGGMAVVYRAHRADGSFDKQVAIKVLDHFRSITSDEARFGQERRILGQLDTPHIAKIIDAGTADGLAYFVMEYVDGVHLDAYCREQHLSIPEKLRLFLQVCSAVSLAHNNGIVHRDLKPSNILVDKDGTPKLIDFGIAKVLDAEVTAPLTVQGLHLVTLLYASPEQLAGNPDIADLPSSDIYSLGVVLFEVLTGRKPIEPPPGASPADVPRFIVESEPVASSTFDRSLAGDLDTIVLKALRKDRRERYQSVEQFATYVKLYLESRPLPEGPPGFLYRVRKFVKRNRTQVAVSALLLAVLLGGILATERQARLAQRRFEEVRQLATSFLFEFDGAIANLAGATQARRLVVSKGLEYLDRLSREAEGDDTLRQEVAGAYERLAAIQGNVYGSNLGEYKLAAETYEKALAIRKDLVARHPGDTTLKRALGSSYLQMADGWFTRGNTRQAAALYQEGLKILKEQWQSGDRSQATLTGLQRGYSRLCNFLLSLADHKGAIDNCGNSVTITKAVLSASPTDPVLRAALAAAYGQTGNALRIDKRPKEALPPLALAAAEFRKLLSEQPDSNNFARNLAGVHTVMALAYMELGEQVPAIENFERSIETVRGMIKVDPADARPKTTLAVSLIRFAAVLQKAGRAAQARQYGAEGLAIFRSFADRPQATPDDLNNYASFLHEISVPELKDPKTVLAYARRAVSSVAEPSLVFLSTLADAYFAVADVENAITTAQRGLDSQSAVKGSGEAGVRADLERKLQKFKEREARKP